MDRLQILGLILIFPLSVKVKYFLENQNCQLSQVCLKNPLGYLHWKWVAPLPHCEEGWGITEHNCQLCGKHEIHKTWSKVIKNLNYPIVDKQNGLQFLILITVMLSFQISNLVQFYENSLKLWKLKSFKTHVLKTKMINI